MSESSIETLGVESAVPHQSTVGRQLQLAREAKGLSLADVAEALKLGKLQIEALEADNWSLLPGVTFIRGFVRNYGRLVGLEPARLMEQLDLKLDATRPELSLPESTHVDMPSPQGRAQLRDYFLVIAGLVLVVIAVLIYFLLPDDTSRLRAGFSSVVESISAVFKPSATPQHQPVPPPVTPTVADQLVLPPGSTVSQVLTPQAIEPPAELTVQPKAQAVSAQPQLSGVVVPTLAPIPVPQVPVPVPAEVKNVAPVVNAATAASASLFLSFSQESWVEVRDRRGNVVFSQKAAAGSERAVDGEGPFSLVIGNAKAVKVTRRGKAVDLTPHVRGDVARLTLE